MKKFIALALAVVMLAALAVPAFAAEEKTTEVKYTIGESFVFSISPEVNMNDDEPMVEVTVSKLNLLAGHKLTVGAKADVTLTATETNVTEAVTAVVTFGEDVVFNANIVEGVDAAAKDYIEASWQGGVAPTVAGNYAGTATFEASIG